LRRGEGAPQFHLSRESLRSLRRLFAYLGPHWVKVSFLIVLTVLGVGLGLVRPWLTKILIDQAIVARDMRVLRLVALAMLATGTLGGLVGYLNGYFSQQVGHRIIRRMRNQLFEHLHGLTLHFYEENQTGQIMSRITSDTEAVQSAVVNSAQTVVRAVVTLAGAVTMMFVLNTKLALFTFLPVPVFIASIAFYATTLKARYRVFREKIAELNAFLQERIAGVRVVKSFAGEQREQRSLEEKTDANYRAYMRAALIHSSIHPWMSYVGGLSALIIIYVGGGMVIKEEIGLGTMVAFLALLGHFFRPIGEIGGLVGHQIPAGLAAGERVFEFLDADDALPVPAEPARPERIRGAVELRDVFFSYDEEDVLREINLTVAPAETVALVGPSGTGKTTLVELVSRFYDVERGRVLVDGIDVKDYEPRDLRRHIGVVLQEPFLFDTTVRENIAYARPDASDDEVRAAAIEAEAHEFITALPEGYDTVVGERGVKLSVGQKQRISIARALLKDPEVLVLDEATSSVDTVTEKAIQKALEAAARDRTTILIAHRLSTTFFADRILVMDEGRIVEEGAARELLQRQGAFARLYNMQVLEGHLGG
jgi:ABC-type multidrug transport system fused ATPase/permease subunit